MDFLATKQKWVDNVSQRGKVKIKVFGWTAKMKNAIVSDGKEVLRVIEMATQKKSH
mgnify:CR=1 FL=1